MSTVNKMTREALLIAALAILAMVSWCLRDDGTAAVVTELPSAAAVSPTGDAAPTQPTEEPAADSHKTAAEDRSRLLELPDGTTVETLNDAVDAAPLAQFWGQHPWSPIIGVDRSSAGVDWYRHADGSYSTTQMVWRKDLGRHAAMTRVAHPGPAPAAVASK